jgi:hypothetical protein
LELADHRGLRQQPGMAHEHHRGSQSDSYNHALTIGRNEPRLKEKALEMVSQAWMSYQEGLLESFFSDQVPDNQSNRSTPSVNWVCYFIFSRRPARSPRGLLHTRAYRERSLIRCRPGRSRCIPG